MPARKLPLRNSPEAEQVIKRYLAGEGKALAKELGFASRGSLQNAIIQTYEVRKGRLAPIKEMPALPQPYPDFKIKPFKAGKGIRDKEDIVVVRADAHVGKKTMNYDLKRYRTRVDNLLGNVMLIIELHRPIGKLHIFYLGDTVQGESRYQGSNVSDTECGAYEQIHDYATPTEASFLLSLAQGVEAIEVHCVWGNHGKYEPQAPSKTNWDLFHYQDLKNAVQSQKNIAVHLPETFYQLVQIFGWRFFLFHGHQIRGSSGFPSYAIKRKLQQWYAYVNGFHYAYGGHFHKGVADEINQKAGYEICPPLITGDEWALEVVGAASLPIQLCFGVHLRKARTFRYNLYTDDSFLPEPFMEVK